jgi:hypothetical protein
MHVILGLITSSTKTLKKLSYAVKKCNKGVVANICNPSILEAEGSKV